MRITREELYRQIWTTPATKLALRYGVSSSYLARVCEGLNVPHPPRGYWARRAAGEEIPVPSLPPAGPGDPLSWEKGVAVLERLPPLELPAQPPRSKGAAGPAKRPAHHPLVTAWRGFLEDAVPAANGYMVPRKKTVLDAFVTKAMIRNAGDALDVLLVELEMRGHRVQLSADYRDHRPPVDVAQRPIRNEYDRRSGDWQPNRPTIVYLRGAKIGLTLFELTEHVRVRRKGADRYVRISDLPPTHRYAPQLPGEADETRDMPSGRFVLRAYSPRRDAPWQHEWTESGKGDLGSMTKVVADALEEVAPVLVKSVEDAEQREREYQAQATIEERRRRARERVEARQRARQAARDELRTILGAWTDAFALEAFFLEVSRRAASLGQVERADVELRIQEARALAKGPDAVDRFLTWRLPSAVAAADGDAEADDDAEHRR